VCLIGVGAPRSGRLDCCAARSTAGTWGGKGTAAARAAAGEAAGVATGEAQKYDAIVPRKEYILLQV